MSSCNNTRRVFSRDLRSNARWRLPCSLAPTARQPKGIEKNGKVSLDGPWSPKSQSMMPETITAATIRPPIWAKVPHCLKGS